MTCAVRDRLRRSASLGPCRLVEGGRSCDAVRGMAVIESASCTRSPSVSVEGASSTPATPPLPRVRPPARFRFPRSAAGQRRPTPASAALRPPAGGWLRPYMCRSPSIDARSMSPTEPHLHRTRRREGPTERHPGRCFKFHHMGQAAHLRCGAVQATPSPLRGATAAEPSGRVP